MPNEHCMTTSTYTVNCLTLQGPHNERHGISIHQPHGCLLNRWFRRRSKKTSKVRVTGLCAGNSPVTGEFPAQMASNAEIVSIRWRHHDFPPGGVLPKTHHRVITMSELAIWRKVRELAKFKETSPLHYARTAPVWKYLCAIKTERHKM